MIHTDEDALICDLAETYHIYDYRALPAKTAASLSCGLKSDSRIKQRLTGKYYPPTQELLILIYDCLRWIQWSKTTDGVKNQNRPESLYDKLMNIKDDKQPENMSFDSPDEFEAKRKEIIRRSGDNEQ